MNRELCPITGLEIHRKPEWQDIELDKNYRVDYYFVGRNIMVAIGKGYATAKGVRIAKALEEQLANENLEAGTRNIYIIDIHLLSGIDMDGREEHRKMIQGLTRFRAVIYAGGSRLLQMSINLARKVHLVPLVTDVMLDYKSAMEKGVWVVVGQEMRESFDLLNQGVLPDTPVHILKNKNGELRTMCFGSRIVFTQVIGDLDQELNAQFNRNLEEQIEACQEEKPRGFYFIQDLGQMKSVSFQARRQFIDFMRNLNQRYPVLEVLTLDASPTMQAIVNLSKILVPFPAGLVNGKKELHSHIHSVLERQFGTRGKPKVNDQGRSKTPNEQLIDFIGSTRWDVPGAIQVSVKESDPIRPIYDAFALIKRDLDEVIQGQLRLEEELRQMAKEAQAATKAKSQFLATMSHEIRTPLNGVIGMTELLLDSGLNPDQRHYADTIKGSGEHLMALINDILDLSRIEAGKLEVEIIPFDLGRVISLCSEAWTFSAREKGVDFMTSKSMDLPKQVCGDPGRLRQILMNLVGNAIKFTLKGVVSLSVEMKERRENQDVIRFTVRDTGIGIPKNRHHMLFQSFHQVDNSMARRFGGSGLGLAITSQLVTLLGGEIGFESEEGVGSEFWCTLPLNRTDIAVSGGVQGVTSVGGIEGQSPGLGILVVEDNVVNQKVVLGMLRHLGIQADLAVDGIQALECLKAQQYGLVFMDCQMPGMDGFEATKRIRNGEAGEISQKTRIIAMTANAMAGDRERCLEVGMDDYIAKPLTRKALQVMLEKSLHRPFPLS